MRSYTDGDREFAQKVTSDLCQGAVGSKLQMVQDALFSVDDSKRRLDVPPLSRAPVVAHVWGAQTIMVKVCSSS